MAQSFPRTEVAGVSLPRMLIGSNWINGFSHTSPAADKLITSTHSNTAVIGKLLDAYLAYGIDAVMAASADGESLLWRAIMEAEQRTGKKIIQIDTPILDVTDSAEGRRSAEQRVKLAARSGATFCFPHHTCAEQLVNKHKATIDRLPDYLAMIRDAGMIPGLSAHMPELILYSDANEYDVQTYVQIYNCMGFLMQVEIEYIHKVIWDAKKPVMTIKAMAAGRVTPFVGLTFSFSTLRPCDMVTLGAFYPEEVHEDVEIALAAIERRRPMLEGRNSPDKSGVLGV